MSARASRLAILAIILLAFALRAGTLLSQSLWRDEVDALLFATRPLPQLLDMFRLPGQNGPLYFLLLRPWLAVAGHSEFSLRLPAALAGTLAVPITYLILRRLTARPSITLLAALLLATAPYATWYGGEAKMYGLLTALVPASLLAVTAIARPRRAGHAAPWVALYVLTSLALYTHFVAALIIPVQVIWLLLLPWERPTPARFWRKSAAVAIYGAALLLPYAPFLRWMPAVWLSTYETGHPFVPFGDMVEILAGGFSRGVLGAPPLTLAPYMVALAAGLIAWPLVSGGRRDEAAQPKASGQGGPSGDDGPASFDSAALRSGCPDSAALRSGCADAAALRSGCPDSAVLRSGGLSERCSALIMLLLGVWLVLPVLLLYGVSLGVPVFTDRYLIWTLPAYLGLLACGIIALSRVARPLGLLVAVIIVALNLWSCAYTQVREPIKADFRGAARHVVEQFQPGDALLYQIPYNRYTFTYYASGRLDPEDGAWAGVDGPYTNGGMSEADVDAYLASRLGTARTIWFIASEVPMWDDRGLAQGWLDANARAADRASFARVDVTRYER